MALTDVALSGSIEMDSQLLRYKTPWAHYVMRWDEVEAIETEQDDPDVRYRALGRAALVFVNTRAPRTRGVPGHR